MLISKYKQNQYYQCLSIVDVDHSLGYYGDTIDDLCIEVTRCYGKLLPSKYDEKEKTIEHCLEEANPIFLVCEKCKSVFLYEVDLTLDEKESKQ